MVESLINVSCVTKDAVLLLKRVDLGRELAEF